MGREWNRLKNSRGTWIHLFNVAHLKSEFRRMNPTFPGLITCRAVTTTGIERTVWIHIILFNVFFNAWLNVLYLKQKKMSTIVPLCFIFNGGHRYLKSCVVNETSVKLLNINSKFTKEKTIYNAHHFFFIIWSLSIVADWLTVLWIFNSNLLENKSYNRIELQTLRMDKAPKNTPKASKTIY